MPRSVCGVRGVVALAGLGLWALAPGPSLILAASPPTPTITLSVTSGAVRTPVDIRGSGFPPNMFVALYIDEPSVYIGTPGPKADAQGTFEKSITWPGSDYDVTGHVDPSKPGPHSICGDTSYPGHVPPVEARECVLFVVTSTASPSAKPSPGAAAPGRVTPGEILAAVVLLALAIGTWLYTRRPA